MTHSFERPFFERTHLRASTARLALFGWLRWTVLGFGVTLAGPAAAIGLLVPQDGSQALKLVQHHVQVRVQERAATTQVEQVFSNPNPRPVEAVYFFPLPVDATVDAFALWMNGVRQTGKVLPKDEARRVYESIVRATRDPALIEYVDAQLFQARVFPIPAHGEQRVALTFSHLVPYENGVHRYVYPMRTDHTAAKTLREFLFAIEVNGKMPVQNLYSPTHKISSRIAGNHAEASFEKDQFSLQDDFRLYWSVDDHALGMTLLTHQEGDEPGYFLLMASPQDALRRKEVIGKRVSFVIDTSGSMAGEKMNALKSALSHGIAGLGEDDLFQIVTFGGHVERFAERMVAANDPNKRDAMTFIRNLEPLGGTPIDEALQLALSSATGSRQIPHQLILITDGRPTIGEIDPVQIRQRVRAQVAREARIFALGVGNDVQPAFLDALAEENHGRSVYLRGNAEAADEIRNFFDRVRYPVLFDVDWQIRGQNGKDVEPIRIFHAHPQHPGDLFYGEQLLVLGRYRGVGKIDVTLTGKTSHGARTFRYAAELKSGTFGHAFLPKLWAQREVARMMREIRAHGEKPDLVTELTQLALRFGIVTPFTSYLVVEENAPASENPQQAPEILLPPQRLPRPHVLRRAREDSGMKASASLPSRPAYEPAAWPQALHSSAALRADSGEDAVQLAKEMKTLEQGVLHPHSAGLQSEVLVLGRAFHSRAGGYVDSSSRDEDEVLQIQRFSAAYFQVLQLRPELKPALMLSGRVRLRVGAGRTLLIDTAEAAPPSASTLGAFLAVP